MFNLILVCTSYCKGKNFDQMIRSEMFFATDSPLEIMKNAHKSS